MELSELFAAQAPAAETSIELFAVEAETSIELFAVEA